MDTPCVNGHPHYWVFQDVWVDELGVDWWTYYCVVCERTEHREANLEIQELEQADEPLY